MVPKEFMHTRHLRALPFPPFPMVPLSALEGKTEGKAWARAGGGSPVVGKRADTSGA